MARGSFLLFLILSLAVYNLGLSQTPVLDSIKKVVESGSDQQERLRALQALISEYSRSNLAKAKLLAHDGVIQAGAVARDALGIGVFVQHDQWSSVGAKRCRAV